MISNPSKLRDPQLIHPISSLRDTLYACLKRLEVGVGEYQVLFLFCGYLGCLPCGIDEIDTKSAAHAMNLRICKCGHDNMSDILYSDVYHLSKS